MALALAISIAMSILFHTLAYARIKFGAPLPNDEKAALVKLAKFAYVPFIGPLITLAVLVVATIQLIVEETLDYKED